MNYRLRVRPLEGRSPAEIAAAWSNRLALSVPHVGEAIDYASGISKLTGHERPRIIHYGHELGAKCDTAPEEKRGRCLFLDYVPASLERDQHELDVAGLVAKAR